MLNIPNAICLFQANTRSVIDPIPAAVSPDGDAASKAADKQRPKKGKMSDEEIMDKLSMAAHKSKPLAHFASEMPRIYSWLRIAVFVTELIICLCFVVRRNHSQYWRS